MQPLSDSESEELEPPEIDSEVAEYDPDAAPVKFHILQLKSKYIPDCKPKDKILKFDCKG